jgi:hypothetical protein
MQQQNALVKVKLSFVKLPKVKIKKDVLFGKHLISIETNNMYKIVSEQDIKKYKKKGEKKKTYKCGGSHSYMCGGEYHKPLMKSVGPNGVL